jgi:hypothetical protein
VYRNAHYLWTLIDPIPKNSHLYSRTEVTVFEMIQRIYSDGVPERLYGGGGTSDEVREAERALYVNKITFKGVVRTVTGRHAEYRKYQDAYAIALDALHKAESDHAGVEKARAALEQADADWSRLGYRKEIGKALDIYLNQGVDPEQRWVSEKTRLEQATETYTIGDSVPYVETAPEYDDWRNDGGWTSVDLEDAAGSKLGKMSVRVVALHRTWLDWKLLHSGIWAWRADAQNVNEQISNGRPFDASEEQFMPLIPVSIIIARDLVIKDAAKGVSFEDASRDHVRLIGVISASVPECPDEFLVRALRRAMQNAP